MILLAKMAVMGPIELAVAGGVVLILAPSCRRLQAIDELIALYDAWNKPDESAKWRAKLSPSSS